MSTDVLDPTDDETVEPEVDPSAPSKRRSNLLPAIVLAVGLVAAAFLLRPGPSSDGAAATTTTVAPGPTVALDPMTLNLGDGSLLRIGVAIELAEDVDAAAFSEHGSMNRLRDLIIFEVSELGVEQVSGSDGLDALKATLTEGAERLYGEEFHGLYLTDLVVQ